MLATSQNELAELSKESRGTRGVELDGKKWCEVLYRGLIVTDGGTVTYCCTFMPNLALFCNLKLLQRPYRPSVHNTYQALSPLSRQRPQQDAASPARIRPTQPSAGRQPTRLHTTCYMNNIYVMITGLTFGTGYPGAAKNKLEV